MSIPDFAARGLALRAIGLESRLLSANGADQISRKRPETEAIAEPLQRVLDRIDLSPESFKTLSGQDDGDARALERFLAAVSATDAGLSQLDGRTYTLGTSGPDEALSWRDSNGGLIGRGRGRTVIRNVHPTALASLKFTESCENLYFADMTFDGRVLPSGAHALRNVIFHRCDFMSNPGQVINALQITTDFMDEGVESIYFIDCRFMGAGRMGAEITNHRNDGVVRYANLQFIGCSFLRNGYAVTVGAGLSLSGVGEDVLLDRVHWDGNQGVQLENAGCSRLLVRDSTIRSGTLPANKPPIIFSAVNAIYNSAHHCTIDGLRLVNGIGSAAGRPTMPHEMHFSSTKNLTLRRISAAIDAPGSGNSGKSVIAIADGGTDADGNQRSSLNTTIEQCDLASNSDRPIITFTNSAGDLLVTRNTLHNSNPERSAPLVAAYSSTSAAPNTVHLKQNRLSGAKPHAEKSFVLRTGNSSLEVSDDNQGMPTTFIGVVTITAGQTASDFVHHGLGANSKFLSAAPLGNLSGASFPWTTEHGDATMLRANTSVAPQADLRVEVTARLNL